MSTIDPATEFLVSESLLIIFSAENENRIVIGCIIKPNAAGGFGLSSIKSVSHSKRTFGLTVRVDSVIIRHC